MTLNDIEYSKVTGPKFEKKSLARWLVSKNACFWVARVERSILVYFGLILLLFCMMLLGYKLSNLSFSVIFCLLVFRCVWVCLGMSKIQKNGSFMAKNCMSWEFIGLYEIFTDSKYK